MYLKKLIEINHLKVYFSIRKSFIEEIFTKQKKFVKAVDDVSFEIDKGDTVCLVGESGSGKTTTGRALLKLVSVSDGSINFRELNITEMSDKEFRPLRKELQIIFQDPHASLNPGMTVGQSIEYGLKIHKIVKKEEFKSKTYEVLKSVGLDPPEYFYNKYPATLSGGQKQRIAIARAISLNPKFIVADEPVAMLDMSVRSKILKLMMDLKKERDLTYLFITHDLATAKFVCNKIMIMYLGKIVEAGSSKDIYSTPKHPYTMALISAIPKLNPNEKAEKELPAGEIPNPIDVPPGCRFHPRCKYTMEICKNKEPEFKEIEKEHKVACFLYEFSELHK